MSDALQMRGPEKRANENHASSYEISNFGRPIEIH